MKPAAWTSVGLAALLALSLSACSERAAGNPNAPGSPGTGNATELVRPAVADGPPGGPSGIVGSAPHPGSSGGDAVVGATGGGTSDPGGLSPAAQPGTGLNGGLNAGAGLTGSFPAGGTGSTNSTSGTSR